MSGRGKEWVFAWNISTCFHCFSPRFQWWQNVNDIKSSITIVSWQNKATICQSIWSVWVMSIMCIAFFSCRSKWFPFPLFFHLSLLLLFLFLLVVVVVCVSLASLEQGQKTSTFKGRKRRRLGEAGREGEVQKLYDAYYN